MLFYQTDGATKHQMRLKSSFFYSANSYRFQWSTQPSSWSNGRLTLSPCDRFILLLILMPWGLCARNVKLNINLGVWRGCGNATANGSSKIEISVKTPRSVVLPPSPLPPLPPSPVPSPLSSASFNWPLSRYFLLKSWLVMEVKWSRWIRNDDLFTLTVTVLNDWETAKNFWGCKVNISKILSITINSSTPKGRK